MKDAELQGRELDKPLPFPNLAGFDVKQTVSDLKLRQGFLLDTSWTPFQDSADPHGQDLWTKRLHHVVVCTFLKGLDDVKLVTCTGEHHDRDCRDLPDSATDVQATEMRNRNVQKNEIRCIRLPPAECLSTVRRDDDLKSFPTQGIARHVEEVQIIVDQENAHAPSH